MAAIGRVLLMDKGAYSGSTIYNQLDWVRDNGASWVCKVDGTVGIAPPTLPTTSNANWTLLAADGSVSGSVAWSAVTGKPFDSVKSGGGIDVNVSNELELDTSYLTGSNISYDNTGSGATSTNVQDALDELFNGGGGGGLSNAFDEVEVNGISLIASGGDTLHLLAGSNISLTPNAGTNTVEIASTGGGGTGGHTMIPTPSSSPSEATVVSTIDGKRNTANDDSVVSAYSVSRWSNEKKIRKTMGSTGISSTGIGTWFDGDPSTIVPSTDEADWWYDSAFQIPDNADDVEVAFKFDPSTNEAIVLGGYILDTTTGKLCIKFGNTITNTTDAKVAVDITYTRNEVD